MRNAGLALLVVVLLSATSLSAGERDAVTFTEDVAPIFAESCMTRHRPGEIASKSLLSYEEARPWARSIKRVVMSRAMPPWHADAAYGEFSNDRRLTDEEIETIVAWVDGGAPRANPAKMSALPEFVDGWQSYLLGPSDAVHQMEEEFTVPASGPNLNPYMDVPMPLDEKWEGRPR